MTKPRVVPVDIDFVQSQPCVLTREASNTTMHLRCGARLQHDHPLDVTALRERPSGFDVTNDHIDVAGWTLSGAAERPLLVRTTLDGTPLADYGDGGIARLNSVRIPGLPYVTLIGAASADDGSTVIAGIASNANHDSSDAKGFLARITATGEVDTNFGDAGVRVLKATGSRRTFVNAVRVLSNGNVLVVGSAGASPRTAYHPFAMLIDGNGEFVPTFGTGGVAVSTVAQGSGSATFATLPDADHVSEFPVPIGTSRNVGGTVYSYVVRLAADGTLQRRWGGIPSKRFATLYNQPATITQGMDIDVAPDGSVLGAAEVEHAGDYDSFVARFGAGTGAIDTTFGTYGVEAIDTAVGSLDAEYTMAMTTDTTGRAWVVGGRTVRRRESMHMFHTVAHTTRYRSVRMSVVRIGPHARADRCGRTASHPCVIARGSTLRVGTSVVGWPTRHLRELQPVFHMWSKRPGRAWTPTERIGRAYRFGSRTAAELNLRLPVGQHEVTVTRNGASTWGSSWYGTLYVRVR